jgi:hypothetical protein
MVRAPCSPTSFFTRNHEQLHINQGVNMPSKSQPDDQAKHQACKTIAHEKARTTDSFPASPEFHRQNRA